MMNKALLFICALFLIHFADQSLAIFDPSLKLPKGGKPNPLNPNFTYVEVNKVDKAKLNIPYPGEFYTGYISPNSSSGSRIFYQLYSAGGNKRASTINESAPLIMQLPGGPGCPGGGSYYEHGPFRVDTIDGDFIPVLNEVSWNDDYHLLYLDNPVGVGYSVENNDMPRYASDNGVYLTNFLVRLFELFPSLKNQPFYGVGESYGGHFLLGLANNLIKNPDLGIKLTGLGFQGGWVDPYWQGSMWAKGAYAIGLTDTKRRNVMDDYITQFQKSIKAGKYEDAYNIVGPLQAQLPKGFDVGEYRNDTEWDATTLIWLNLPNTKKYLAADPATTWQCITLRPWYYLDFPQSYAPNVSYILNNYKNISFLFYQGQEDFEVPAAGTENSLHNLAWTEIPLYIASPNNIWKDTQGRVIGQYKHYSRLTYATVYKAGHNAAHDQPWSVKDLVKKWVNNKW